MGESKMTNKNYVIQRKDVNVGTLVLTSEIERWKGINYDTLKKGDMVIGAYQKCRSMLFKIDENLFTNDLLFDSPSYPILGITSDEYCLSLNGRNHYIISKSWNLEELLGALGYTKELTYGDIKDIRRLLFNARSKEYILRKRKRIYEQYKECFSKTRDKTLLETHFDFAKCNSFRPTEELVRKLKK